jgi:hypothetical protein
MLLAASILHFLNLQNIINADVKSSLRDTVGQHSKFPQHSNRDILISISTVQTRRNDLVSTINSILDQTVLPSLILINFASDTAYPVAELQSLLAEPQSRVPAEKRPRIYFQGCDPQWRSTAKLLGALQYISERNTTYSNTTNEPDLIYADDDMIYPNDWIESLLEGRSSLPLCARCAVGTRGWRVLVDYTWGVESQHFDGYVILGHLLRAPYRVGVLTGGGGVLIRPSYFDNTSVRHPAMLEAALMDDIWLSGSLAAAGVARWVVPLRRNIPLIHLGNDRSVIDPQLPDGGAAGRAAPNGAVLRHFADHWERELLWSGPTRPGDRGWPPWTARHACWLVFAHCVRTIAGLFG